MTTGSQLNANRRNAMRSTGPKTRKGKATSSSNARSHGLTAPVPMADIQTYLDVLCSPSKSIVSHEGVVEDYTPAVLRLAEAEAHLHRCRVAERAHQDLMFERAMDTADPWRTHLSERLKRKPFDVEAGKIFVEHSEEPYNGDLKSVFRLFIRTSAARPARLHNKANTLRRYRREAESRRRKAFRDWLEFKNSETNPISS